MTATVNRLTGINVVDVILLAVILACWLGVACSNVNAQSFPDAGSVLRQIERQESIDAPRLPDVAPAPAASAADVSAQTEQTIPVKRFRFVGNRSIDESALQAVVVKYIGLDLTPAKLQSIADEIAAVYQDQGLLANTTLSRQDVSEGEITIQVTEAKFGGIVLDDAQLGGGIRVPLDTIKKFVGRGQVVGKQMSREALDRGLLLADDLPGVTVQGALEAGESDGETNVRLKVTPRSWYSGDVTANNYGARSTGQNQALANLSFASPLRLGDQLQVLAL